MNELIEVADRLDVVERSVLRAAAAADAPRRARQLAVEAQLSPRQSSWIAARLGGLKLLAEVTPNVWQITEKGMEAVAILETLERLVP